MNKKNQTWKFKRMARMPRSRKMMTIKTKWRKWRKIKMIQNKNKFKCRRPTLMKLLNSKTLISKIKRLFCRKTKHCLIPLRKDMKKNLLKWNKIYNWSWKLTFMNLRKEKIYISTNLLKIMIKLLKIYELITIKLQEII